MYAEEKQYPSAASYASQYPRQLRRPAFRRVSSSAIKAVAPELGNVAVEFILQKIGDVGEGMYYTARKSTPKCPPSRLPREIAVSMPSFASEATPAPTHVLAVYSTPSALAKQRVLLHSIHALILAATCANLPPLPYSTPARGPSTVTLPVIPLSIPSPEMFGALLEYLYTFDTDALICSLLPVSNAGNGIPPPDVMASKLQANPKSIPGCLARIHGLYNDVCALGVFDEKLWRTIEAAWEVCWIAMGN
ncbi:hypothetical protein M422DRAFT_190333 [Sphaerobolus stellatus SS14]|uniref:Uncharacterized protein n=1 Tax=Sphaerobolus stellatus (strain SS14) TaxID=990650 RepID=A0A0C9TF86_SPHS4|nr:hypothetical protein M422DRAFT_190333 [Sphaerobolus stellatus SS14]